MVKALKIEKQKMFSWGVVAIKTIMVEKNLDSTFNSLVYDKTITLITQTKIIKYCYSTVINI